MLNIGSKTNELNPDPTLLVMKLPTRSVEDLAAPSPPSRCQATFISPQRVTPSFTLYFARLGSDPASCFPRSFPWIERSLLASPYY